MDGAPRRERETAREGEAPPSAGDALGDRTAELPAVTAEAIVPLPASTFGEPDRLSGFAMVAPVSTLSPAAPVRLTVLAPPNALLLAAYTVPLLIAKVPPNELLAGASVRVPVEPPA